MKTFLIQHHVPERSEINLTEMTPGSWVTEAGQFVTLGLGEIKDESERSRVDLVIHSIIDGPNLNIGNYLQKTFEGNNLFVSRLSKPDQGFVLQRYIDQVSAGLMYQPRVWRNHKAFTGIDSKYVILRPTRGARGIGMVVLDPNKTSITAVLESVRSHMLEQKQQESEAVHDPERITAGNKAIRSKLADLPGNPVWCSEGDRTVYEGANVFLQGFFIQEYVTDVSKEYRVIIGGNNTPVYAIERTRTHIDNIGNVPVMFARSHKLGIQKSCKTLAEVGVSERIAREFCSFISEYDFSLFSFDLFVTKTGRWGVFEFSPEFGTHSVGNDFCFRESKIFIERVIKKLARVKLSRNLL